MLMCTEKVYCNLLIVKSLQQDTQRHTHPKKQKRLRIQNCNLYCFYFMIAPVKIK